MFNSRYNFFAKKCNVFKKVLTLLVRFMKNLALSQYLKRCIDYLNLKNTEKSGFSFCVVFHVRI